MDGKHTNYITPSLSYKHNLMRHFTTPYKSLSLQNHDESSRCGINLFLSISVLAVWHTATTREKRSIQIHPETCDYIVNTE